jgi:hypothetical protein
MAGQALKITRQQLASFLPDEETIRKFEKLVLLVEEINTTSIDEIQTETGIALQKANEAIDRFYNIFGSSIKLDVASFNGILSGADTNLQLAMDTIDDHNHDGRYYTETELDGGQLDTRYYTETEVDALLASGKETIVTTSTTESIDVETCTIIRQTASGVTTSLINISTGSAVTIKNRGGGDNTINLTIDGVASPLLADGDSVRLAYNGTDWDAL